MGLISSRSGGQSGPRTIMCINFRNSQEKQIEWLLMKFRTLVLEEIRKEDCGEPTTVDVYLMTAYDSMQSIQDEKLTDVNTKVFIQKILAAQQASERVTFSFRQEKGSVVHIRGQFDVFLSYYFGDQYVLIARIGSVELGPLQFERFVDSLDNQIGAEDSGQTDLYDEDSSKLLDELVTALEED
ncbi:hypothetical protein NDN08_005519 [Rhodosorus marinus]|uniref:Uncharacterized protein n=1 Tax=Rhodosorus marinus TaxID=101924 RepID=A0AAV8V2P9_9RHOD|nr:hypothetical protein NDN08_005519 [Rhodosorus marinus]